MTDTITLLKAIPSSFWGAAGTIFGAVVGAAVTLFTSNLAERRNITRAEVQREHESTEKARERTATLRREVYLPVAAEFNATLKFLASMHACRLEEIGQALPLSQLTASAAKLSLVSSPATALVAHKLSVECNLLYMRFAPLAMQIAVMQNTAHEHEATINKCIGQKEGLELAIERILESGEPENKRLAGLNLRNEVLKKQYDQDHAALGKR